jgi:hypothetical protein
MSTGIDKLLAERGMALRDFGLLLARQIAALAVDPHGYFEKTYIARIESAQTDHEINGVLAQLVQWVASSSVSDAERARLDRELDQQGLPGVADLSGLLLP